MDANNNGFKGKQFKVNPHVMELINENIILMDENIKLILENKKLRERVERLEKDKRVCSGRCLVKEGEECVAIIVRKRGEKGYKN